VYFKKKNKNSIGENMSELVKKISEYLDKYPNSNARRISKAIGLEKKATNSCLYAGQGSHFQKHGLTPPLWRNITRNEN
jgi:hypothetical protein